MELFLEESNYIFLILYNTIGPASEARGAMPQQSEWCPMVLQNCIIRQRQTRVQWATSSLLKGSNPWGVVPLASSYKGLHGSSFWNYRQKNNVRDTAPMKHVLSGRSLATSQISRDNYVKMRPLGQSAEWASFLLICFYDTWICRLGLVLNKLASIQ